MKNKNPFVFNFGNIIQKKSKPIEWEESAVDTLSPVEGFVNEYENFSVAKFKFLIFIIFFIIFFKIFSLQILNSQDYQTVAENNWLRKQIILAPRGLIKDRNDVVLAKNVASLNLIATPVDLNKNEIRKELEKLSTLIRFDVDKAEAKIKKTPQSSLEPVVIKNDISLEESIVFETKASDFVGYSVQKVPVREYLNPNALFHVLGYSGYISDSEYERIDKTKYDKLDFIGKTGIENMYESYLHGANGYGQIEVDARGYLISKLGSKEPVSGKTLYLNLDFELQEFLFNQLKGNSGKRRSAGIALNPKNGEVLALVSLPGFDGGKFMKGFDIDEYEKVLKDKTLPLFNRAIAGTYPPGSTVKPMVAIAGLEEGVIGEYTKYNDKGVLVIPHQYDPKIEYNFYGWKRDGLGLVDVKQAIAKSSDIFFYIVSGGYQKQDFPGLGIDKLASYYRKFNLGKLTEIDLPGEKTGLVPDPLWKQEFYKNDKILSRWYLGDTYHVGIGQGDLLSTPLQVAVWTAAIANKGVGMQPQVLKKIVDQNDSNKTIFEQKPLVLFDRFVDIKNIWLAQEGMRQTVLEGSGRALNNLSISSAGKTGTSQFDGSDPNKTHAWFTAYAPYENPEIVITVLVEAGGEGSAVSVPVVKETLKWWVENRHLNK